MSDEIRALLDAAAQTHPDTCLCHNCARQLRAALATERAAHQETKADWKRRHTAWLTEQQAEIDAHTSTRASLAKAEARVKELEAKNADLEMVALAMAGRP